MKNNKIELFNESKECCGCGACKNICPKDAIIIKEDEYGFVYPEIEEEKCIECKLCKKVCAFQKDDIKNSVLKSYAGVSKKENMLKKAASGAIFASLATKFLNKGGIVYGCSMEFEKNQLYPKHIRVTELIKLNKILGSKYVQSDLNNSFKAVKEDLNNKKLVLFSGTPCQISALNLYLKSLNISSENLYTIDIICHGVPNSKFFRDYINELSKKLNGTIIDFKFRDKSNGWGLLANVKYIKNNGKVKRKLINAEVSSYFKLFLEASIYRISCYNCKYTNSNRPANLTLGDFWGIQTEHPDYLKINGGELEEKKGISCILVNNKKGIEFIDKYGEYIILKESNFKKIANGNEQLKFPSKVSDEREKILFLYKNKGYIEVENYFKERIKFKKYKIIIKTLIKSKINRTFNKCI